MKKKKQKTIDSFVTVVYCCVLKRDCFPFRDKSFHYTFTDFERLTKIHKKKNKIKYPYLD